MAGLLFIAVLAGLVTAGVQMALQAAFRRRRVMFDAVAAEFYAEVLQERRDLWLRVRHSGTELLAGAPGGMLARDPFVCLSKWPDRNLELEVRPWTLTAWLGLSQMRPVRLNSSMLRGQLIVAGNQPQLIRQMFSPQVQAQLLVLRRANSYGRLQLTIAHGEFCLRKRGAIESVAALRMLLTACLQLIDAALANTGEGVELTESVAAVEDIRCPVCGESPAGRMVECSSCGTPHHDDCWSYNGACARYGCRHSRSRALS